MLGTEKRGPRKLKMTLRSFRLQVHQVKKTKKKKKNSQKLTKARDKKIDRNRAGETERWSEER